ncbi:MAG: hypothetical protein JKY60_20360 [Kordiimonadaceae bacterium]|nr:hypothetical protein [Kordiimonadaceae bacterium]
MSFRRVLIVAALVFVAAVIWKSIHLATDSADTAAAWGFVAFVGLMLIPTERFSADNIMKLIKIWKGKPDD